ncbi:hypothetical protein LQU94_02140 [Peptoniphilus sp. KCTC 25270]|uniref:penicillin-binding transpeptidase domain-containing protein n=1 Tax=Peptoniphilus sp. KCTC 25270 TaxID=2897414 RepID=UPI001E45B970|nr:penicillin-binding transpeptidase domain-containing protein [Peptoniphilus sp. KCTC 25270]MCD1146912.1 hypothetical protein [Peptoniphilus sp. KCTC 25270]
MKDLLNKIRGWNRMHVFQYIVLALFVLLIFQLFRITVLQGKSYRELADSRRLKEVQVTAQRGNIKDRNGVILAGNRPVFTVQLRKDELETVDPEIKNNNFLRLSRYIEEDGVEYKDSFPIQLNSFVFRNLSGYTKEESVEDLIFQVFSQEENWKDLLGRTYQKPYKNHFSYSILRQVLNATGWDSENGYMDYNERTNTVSYRSEPLRNQFKEAHNLSKEAGIEQDLPIVLANNETIIRQIYQNSIGRELIYKTIQKNHLLPQISLRKFGLKYFDDYIEAKAVLMKNSSKITWDSTAKEDFYSLLREKSFYNLLLQDGTEENKEPLHYLKEYLENNTDWKEIKYTKDGNYLQIKNKEVDITEDVLKEMGKAKSMEGFLSLENMRSLAQRQIITDGINPGISIGDGNYQYTSLKNAMDFFGRYRMETKDGAEKLFDEICKRRKVEDSLSPYEKRDILNIYNEVDNQGNYAYVPINYAYEVSDETVAKIEENLPINQGVEISIEPIRNYPLGNSAAHVLGYIGNIAMDTEIEKFVNKNGYDRNALIGKTGIENVYEDRLHGTNGSQHLTVDSVGNTTEIIRETAPKPGKDVQLTIDVDIQQKAEEILKKELENIRKGGQYQSPWGTFQYLSSDEKGRPYSQATSGSIVVVDVKDGGVLAMANYPDYDPNLFAKGINAMNWESLMPEEEDNPLAPRPLYNTAMQSAVQPGSIFKMVTGMAGLEKGLDPKLAIPDGGFVDVGNHRFGCWLWNQKGEVHGDETLADAIRDSCNYYFYTIALGENQKTGQSVGVKVEADDISKMAKQFGLGETSGLEIKIPQETKGVRPNPESKGNLLKTLLNNFLNNHIESLYIGKEELQDEKKQELINKIIASLDEEKTMTRPQVYEFLKALEIDPDKRVEGQRVPFVDLLKYTYIDQAKWTIADTLNVTIGQGNNSYTPVQIARYVMALANHGDLHKLHIVDRVVDPTSKKVLEKTKIETEKIGITNEAFYDEIRNGMEMVADSGVNEAIFKDFPVDVAIKTGTAQRSGVNPYTGDTYDSFAWEVGFAPSKDPEIAVCILLFQGGSGSNASPLMQGVMAEYFGLNKKIYTDELPIETKIDF